MTSVQSGSHPLRVLIAGGGTGGHLYPGIAVARALLVHEPGARITFVGTARGLESTVVPREGFELDTIRSAGLKGQSLADRLRSVALLPASALDAWRVVSRRRPDVVLGVGGYSSGPVVLVAALRRVPAMVLEPNAIPGLTNRLLVPFVRAAAVAHESTLGHFRGKGFVSGTPVRSEFRADHRLDERAPGSAVRVLIVGGSQGAHAINVAAVEAAPRLARGATPLAVVHQTGTRDVELVGEAYRRTGLDARVEPFLFEMDREMSAADLVVCRAGALTMAELAASGRPSVLVPLPTAADDHQRKNAEVFAKAGAARLLLQRDLTGDTLASHVLELAADRPAREAMGRAAAALARPEAAGIVADRLLSLARRGSGGRG